MPENSGYDVLTGIQAPVEIDKQRFERERLTRRQALRKFGITAGMATFAMFSVDDLARMVGRAMQQRAGDNKIAGQIALEFQQAGIAMAAPPLPSCTPNDAGVSVAGYCLAEHRPTPSTYPSPSVCIACCGGVFRNYCKGKSGVNWPSGGHLLSYLDDNTYDDGHVCYDKCTGN